jgi:hypothetical protein
VKIKNAVVASALALAFGNAQATLFDRGGGLIYDDAFNVTWLSNANLLGQLSWDVAQDSITVLNSLDYLGFNNWRLPKTALIDSGCSTSSESAGFGCTGSELGHLFYDVLGGVAGNSVLDVNNGQLALFTNVQAGRYWSATLSPFFPGPYTFSLGGGTQDSSNNYSSSYYSWLVRDGDVAAPIPEPETYAMLLAGLGILGLVRRRKRRV